MSAPNCAQCEHGTITMHSSTDRCSHENNLDGHGDPVLHPVALRGDEKQCGPSAVWFVPRLDP